MRKSKDSFAKFYSAKFIPIIHTFLKREGNILTVSITIF